MVIVVYLPFGWNHQSFWHRRKPTESLAFALKGQGAVIVVEPFVSLTTGWYRLKERRKISCTLRQGRLHQKKKNLFVLMPVVWMPVRLDYLGLFEKLNYWFLASQIRRSIKSITTGKLFVLSWFYRPEQEHFVGLAGEHFVVYECYDQHHIANDVLSIPGYSEILHRKERKLLSKTDLVITTSEELLHDKRKHHSNVVLFHNAADAKFFMKVQDSKTIISEKISQLRHPILGYLGSINDDLDLDLLKYIAKSKPDWTLIIAGEALDQFEVDFQLLTFRNVKLAGWIRDEIPNYFKAVDVCMIPFRTDSRFNQYRNPNKLHEYIAMGKPVVSTNISNIRPHGDIIYIAKEKKEFLACIEKALMEDGPDKIFERLGRASENTWEKRADRVLEKVREMILLRSERR